jgi:hypothetical protein
MSTTGGTRAGGGYGGTLQTGDREMMGDGENINNVIRTGSMDDVGTRMKFLLELYELWQIGLDILDRYDRSKPFYDEKKKELENATRLLMYHIQKDYKEVEAAAAINLLPKKAEDIKDEEK